MAEATEDATPMAASAEDATAGAAAAATTAATATVANSVSLVEAAKAAGLTKLLFVRHASSHKMRDGAASRADAPHDWKFDDQMRCLTDKGWEQCEAAEWFSAMDVRAILSSPARRATDTAMGMQKQIESEGKQADGEP